MLTHGPVVTPTFTARRVVPAGGRRAAFRINGLPMSAILGTRIATPRLTMKLTFERLWRVLPVPVIVLDRMPGRLVGLSMGLFVVVRSDYAGDRPTIVHELVHCRQFWRGGLLVHMLRYYASRDYRLRVELEAFGAELDACDADQRGPRLDDAARALASGYHVGLDVHACRHLLLHSARRSDAVILEAPSYTHLVYRPGVPLVGAVVMAGQTVLLELAD